MWDNDGSANWQMLIKEVTDFNQVVDSLERIRVPGGWIYRTIVVLQDGEHMSMVYVPDKASDPRS